MVDVDVDAAYKLAKEESMAVVAANRSCVLVLEQVIMVPAVVAQQMSQEQYQAVPAIAACASCKDCYICHNLDKGID